MLHKFKWLWKYYRRHRYVLAVLVFLTPVQAVIGVTVPQMFGFAVDNLKSGGVSEHFLSRWITGAGAAFGLSPVASYGRVSSSWVWFRRPSTRSYRATAPG